MKFTLSVVLAFTCLYRLQAQSQNGHHYVVVGVFQQMDNAVSLTDRANKQNFSAHYAINPGRNLYYVYILDSENKKNAFSFLGKIKEETEFKDAWIFAGQLGNTVEPVPAKEEPVVVKDEVLIKEPVAEPVKEEVVVEKEPEVIQPVKEEPKPEGKPFYFKMISAATGKEVNGEVRVALSKSAEYQSFPSNKIVYVTQPKTGVLQVVTVSPGYKEMKRSVNYNDPAASATEIGSQQEAIIAFPLITVKPGDFVQFANVRFFPGTAILQPESQNELNALIELLKEQNVNVKIHGHSNGDKAGETISQGSSKDFFALDESSNLRETASSKKLTELRAQLVSDYFVSQGIESDRITVKGEGGKQSMYSGKSPLAAQNDRVEIEIKKRKK
jgi:outer membrane protein OmpA-like peptidoglycan-associated protein